MHLCNMLIDLLTLCLELCGAIRYYKYALHAVTTYFSCLYVRAEDDFLLQS